MLKSKKYQFTALSIALFISFFMIAGISKVGALSQSDGISTQQLPNNGISNGNVPQKTPWMVVTGPGSNGMRSPFGKAIIYIKENISSFTFTIENACDSTLDDNNGGNANTDFSFTGVSSVNITSGTGTVDADLVVRCTAGSNLILNITLSPSGQPTVDINGDIYRGISILAEKTNQNPTGFEAYYVNRFRYSTSNTNVLISYASTATDPGTVTSNYTGISYDRITGNNWGWGTQIAFAPPCNFSGNMDRNVYFYDTDHNSANESTDPLWQTPNHPMFWQIDRYDRRTGTLVNSPYKSGILTGGNNTADFAVNNNATPKINFDWNYVYVLKISNINVINSLQIALPFSQIYANARCTQGQPVGFIDSCYLDGSNTVILGWAYDDDVSGSKPDVRLSVTGQPDTTYQTNEANYYRVPQIENFLNTGGYGSNNRDGVYGFKATYSGLYVGGNYSISGTVINSGPNGSDVPIGVNTTNSSLGFYFINGKIPNSCLSNSASQVVCITPIKTVWVGEEFYIETSVSNNSSSAVTLAGPATYQITQPVTGTVLRSGNGLPYISSSSPPYQSFPYNLPANSSVTIRSDQTPPPINLSSVGTYGIKWDVPIGSGLNAGGDCGAVQPKLLAHSVPYTRFYGNDVIAGGGYGDCSATSGINANGYGEFGTPADQTTYRGTASELAVFASGAINGVLPGSQSLIARNPVNELAFANDPSTVDLTTGGLNSPAFGGSFGPTICASDFWNQVPDKTQLTTLPSSTVNLGTLSPGTYYYLGNINITPANINNGTKITIYVDGDTIIGSATADALNSNNPNKYNQTVSYNQPNSSWSDIDKIPLIRIITKGNIYIDNNMSQVDGMYIAVSKDDGSGGEIQTCAQYTSTVFNDLSANDQASKTFIASECNHKLTVYGAFVAKKVKLLRTNGNVLSGVARETSDSVNVAESFVFSPELYLALLADSTAAAGFDAILSLPPAL